jgi:ATP-binding protein involved in chromosome partitioning
MADDTNKQQVLDALKGIIDPDLKQDIVSLGLVKDILIKDGKVSFTLELTTPAHPLKAKFKEDAEKAVSALPGVKSVDVAVTARGGAEPKEELLTGVKNTIAVASGKGGVGKSTIAANLALALAAEGAKVGLLDADVYGPSLPILLGIKRMPDVVGEKKLKPIEKYGIKVMSLGFLIDADQAVIWRGPMVHSLLTQFLRDVEWGELDYLIVDLPPGTGDAQLTLSQSIPLAGAVVVTTPQAMASSIAGKVVSLFRKMNVHVLGAVENMSYFVCDGCGKEHDIFDRGGGERLCGRLGVPFLGAIPLDPRMRIADDAGKPIVASDPQSKVAQEFISVARAVVEQVAIANASGKREWKPPSSTAPHAH